jgi:hypothetical protein
MKHLRYFILVPMLGCSLMLAAQTPSFEQPSTWEAILDYKYGAHIVAALALLLSVIALVRKGHAHREPNEGRDGGYADQQANNLRNQEHINLLQDVRRLQGNYAQLCRQMENIQLQINQVTNRNAPAPQPAKPANAPAARQREEARQGYFKDPVGGEYFLDVQPGSAGAKFEVVVKGNRAEYKPIDIDVVKSGEFGRAVRVKFGPRATMQNARLMTVNGKGVAILDDEKKWNIDTPAEVTLSV